MFRRRRSKAGKYLVVALYSLVLAALLGNSASAAQSCKNISGKFTLQPSTTGPECTSPVGLCVPGEYKGDLTGSYSFVASSLIQTVDTPTTGVIFITGDSDLQMKGGTLLLKEALSFRTAGSNPFAGVSTIVGGTGDWAGVTGTYTTAGTHTTAGGEGLYSGEVCFP